MTSDKDDDEITSFFENARHENLGFFSHASTK